jgi:hypothetical protein
MKEALNGPDLKDLFTEEEYSKFCPEEIFAARPDHVKEVGSFREPRPPKFEPIEVESLIELVFFDTNGECKFDDGLLVRDIGYGYTVLDNGNLIAVVSDEQAKSCYLPANHSAPSQNPAPRQSVSLESKDKDKDKDEDSCEALPIQSIHSQRTLRRKPFVIPRFGITILGNSHGFDAMGYTSGFVGKSIYISIYLCATR